MTVPQKYNVRNLQTVSGNKTQNVINQLPIKNPPDPEGFFKEFFQIAKK